MLKKYRAIKALTVLGVFLSAPVAAAYGQDFVPIPTLKPILSAAPKTSKATRQSKNIIPLLPQTIQALLPSGPQSEEASNETVVIPGRKPDFESVEIALQALEGETSSDIRDAELYKDIFVFQREGKMSEADVLIRKLSDEGLMGHVLYQRYMHPTSYRSSFQELTSWLKKYADHPGSQDIYKLAQRRKPEEFQGSITSPKKISTLSRVREPTMLFGKTYHPQLKRSKAETKAIQAVTKAVYREIGRNGAESAYKRLVSDPNFKDLDTGEVDILLGEIAAGYYYNGALHEAYNLATQSVKRSGPITPKAAWIAGLTSWRKGKYQDASRYFEALATSPYASGWSVAAGGYWAARSHMRSGNVKEVSAWLNIAADQPRTFYGLISTRALGRNFEFNWALPELTSEHLEILSAYPAGQRAIDLVAAGQPHKAEVELLRLGTVRDHDLKMALLAYAGEAGLAGLSMRLGNNLGQVNGAYYDAALYPESPWNIETDISPRAKERSTVNDELIHAIIRQESKFEPAARSYSGASGLMQIMPATAVHVTGNKVYQTKAGGHALMNPQTNLKIGTDYLDELLQSDVVGGDLFYLLIAYNAGPGKLGRWRREMPDIVDPLLFVESVPVSETRAYVERVLSNYWIYRMRSQTQTPTLDAVAAGRVPNYYDSYRVAIKPQN